jgi:hypothetical protein
MFWRSAGHRTRVIRNLLTFLLRCQCSASFFVEALPRLENSFSIFYDLFFFSFSVFKRSRFLKYFKNDSSFAIDSILMNKAQKGSGVDTESMGSIEAV